MIIGTAGHIDHGKTTLVKALTGVDCDRWQEEKARGITLDLGYAYSPLPDGAGRLGFIDVPGHEKLVRNMLAGATGIDFALLVVAADDGPMPQSREHLEIVELLGLRQGAVALSKSGLVDSDRLGAARREIRALLAGTALAEAPIHAVDALSGHGVAALRAQLEREARRLAERAASGHFRLAVDRAFTLAGIGTVVTGTASSGRVRDGDRLVVSPTGKPVRVRGLRVHDAPTESGKAGERIALALAGVDKSEVGRGLWLVAPELHCPQNRFAATLRVLSTQSALVHWTSVHCHLGADDVPGRVALLGGDTLAPGETGFAEIILERPVSVVAGDRFILRDAGARHTLGGGRIIDIFPPTRKKRSPERFARLAALADDDPAEALLHMAENESGGADLTRYAQNRNLSAEEIAKLCRENDLRCIAGYAFSPGRWRALGERACAALAEEHARAPDMPGVERDRLRRLTLPTLPRPAFDALTAELLNGGRIAQSGAWLHLPEHRLQLSPGDQALWQTIRPLLDAAPYNPPRVRDVAHLTGLGEDALRKAMKSAARIGLAYPVAHDHYFTAAAVDDLARRVAALCARDGMARAASLRDEIGGGRKVAIHILEFFDRIGYTRRVRDTHVLRCIDGKPTSFAG